MTMPSKLSSIMAAGHPVLAVAAGDVARVVLDADCGATALPGSPPSIADALLAIRRASSEERMAMGERGRDYYGKRMSVDAGSRRLNAILLDALGRH